MVFNGRNRLAKRVWTQLSEKQFWAGAKFVQAVSHGEQQQLKDLPGIARIEEIPNGVDLPALKLPGPQERDVLGLHVGRLAVDHKGLDRMVRAYAICRKKGVSLPRLVLAGPDFRDGRKFLLDLISANGLEQDIELPGPVKGQG